jgi:hypothetical protein
MRPHPPEDQPRRRGEAPQSFLESPRPSPPLPKDGAPSGDAGPGATTRRWKGPEDLEVVRAVHAAGAGGTVLTVGLLRLDAGDVLGMLALRNQYSRSAWLVRLKPKPLRELRMALAELEERLAGQEGA